MDTYEGENEKVISNSLKEYEAKIADLMKKFQKYNNEIIVSVI